MRADLKWLLISMIIMSGLLKVWVGLSVIRPFDRTILDRVTTALIDSGLSVAGPTEFASRPALLVRKADCLFHLMPVSEQGWHDQAIRHSLEADQQLILFWKGQELSPDTFNWKPWIRFYGGMALAFAGIDVQYYPTFAIVTLSNCPSPDISWSNTFSMSFERVGLFQRSPSADLLLN